MAYHVDRQPDFDSAMRKAFPPSGLNPEYLHGAIWTLEHEPHRGKKAAGNIWIIKLMLAPIVVTIYYVIDEAKHRVHLIDLK